MSLPTKCSHQEKYFSCALSPTSIISVQEGEDEFLVGVYCETHSREIEKKLTLVLQRDKIPGRHMKREKLRFVSTECIRTCVSDKLISKGSTCFDESHLLNEREDS
jgi:hypothetical protein